MDKRSLLIGLHELPGIGWKTILHLIDRLDEPGGLLVSEPADLAETGISFKRAEFIATKLTLQFVQEKTKRYAEQGIRIVTWFDPYYPQLLRETPQPPWVLYARGRLELLEQPSIAIVGTRTPTVYGKRVAETIGAELSEAGLCVVSGLARGIDSAAHRGAMGGKGGTIAVLGCGIDVVYPPENNGLYREIAERGLLLSEQPIGTPPHPGLFPLRNRIIAGLTLGTLVVEAAERSGSLITADQALECSRDVYAVPGPITSPKSRGALALLKQGAKVVTCADDIIEETAPYLKIGDKQARRTNVLLDSVAALTGDERQIYELLSPVPTSIEQILMQAETNFGHLHAILLSLQMRKMIEQLPGPAYVTT